MRKMKKKKSRRDSISSHFLSLLLPPQTTIDEMCGLWHSRAEEETEDERLRHAIQQIKVVCGYRPQTLDSLVEMFTIDVAGYGNDPAACANTTRLFAWIACNVRPLTEMMVRDGYLAKDSSGRFGTRPKSGSVLETEFLQDETAPDDGVACVVCVLRKRQLAAECGHVTLCFACADIMIRKHGLDLRCPVCQQHVKKKMFRVFI